MDSSMPTSLDSLRSRFPLLCSQPVKTRWERALSAAEGSDERQPSSAHLRHVFEVFAIVHCGCRSVAVAHLGTDPSLHPRLGLAIGANRQCTHRTIQPAPLQATPLLRILGGSRAIRKQFSTRENWAPRELIHGQETNSDPQIVGPHLRNALVFTRTATSPSDRRAQPAAPEDNSPPAPLL